LEAPFAHAQVFGKFLKLDAPESNMVAVATTPIGGDQQTLVGEKGIQTQAPPSRQRSWERRRLVG
jgi:hypothetical protein